MTARPTGLLSRNWLMGFRTDLLWIILSAAVGWGYLALILGVGAGLENPIRDTFATLRLGDFALPLSLGLVVVASWGIVLDAPHLFATLARTVLDPEEWRVRGGVLLASFGFFLLGPALILTPRWLSAAGFWWPEAAGIGSVAFVVFFRLWAYYHIVRQHWGFLRLYARRNPAAEDEVEFRVDRLVFPLIFYLPIGWFLTAPWYGTSGLPQLGFATEVGGRTLGAWLHLPLGGAWLLTLIGYAGFQCRRYLQGVPRNLPKLALLAATVPLHAAAFSGPLLVLFVVPLVTAGHNLQYQRFVWDYAKRRYPSGGSPAAFSFRNPLLYFALGLVFTLVCYRGPLVAWVSEALAGLVNGALLPLAGLVAGAPGDGGGTLGAEVVAASLLGWAMQHYYLDARIWRVSKDERLRRVLDEPAGGNMSL
jgi:hypothetical protein